MEETKAIRPEIKELFDIIREQAYQYSDAFRSLEEKIAELEFIKEDVLENSRKTSRKLELKFFSLKDELKNEIDLLLDKTKGFSDIYDRAKSAGKALDRMEELRIDLENTKKELEGFINKQDERKDIDLNDLMHKVRASVEREKSSISQKIEVRLALRIKQIESKLIEYNQKLWRMSESNVRDYNKLSEEIADFNIALAGLKNASRDYKNSISEMIETSNRQILEKLLPFERLINDYQRLASEYDSGAFAEKSDIDNISDRLKNLIDKLSNRNKNLEKKLALSMALAGASIILSFLMFIFVVF